MCIGYLWTDISKTDNIGYLWGEEIGGKETSMNTFLFLLYLELCRMCYLFKNILRCK